MIRLVDLLSKAWNKSSPRRAVLMLAVTSATVFASRPATTCAQPAKLDTEGLIGDSVADPGTKYPDIDEAITRFKNGDSSGARMYLEEAKRKAPVLPPPDLMLAKMYLIANNVVNGRVTLNTAVTENPADPEAFVYLADIDLAQGLSVEAESLYDKALTLIEKMGNDNPKRKRNITIRARWGRSQVAERRKNWQGMGTDLAALLKIDEHHAAAHYNMGEALCRIGNYPQAKIEFTKAREDDKKFPSPSLAMALNYDLLGKSDEARKAYQEALRETPDDLAALANFGQFLIKNGSMPEVEKHLEAARKSHPESLDIQVLSGVAASIANKPKDAERYFLDAFALSPTHPVVLNHLAALLIEQPAPESKQRALKYAGINAQINNANADAQVTLAWVYHKLGQTAEVNAALQQALKGGNLTADSSYYVAVMIAGQPGQVPGAKRLLSDALTTESLGIFLRRKEAQELLKNLK